MKEQMLKEIALELNIPCGDNEDSAHWHSRVLYSLIGLQMLSAIYDYEEDNVSNEASFEQTRTVSMQHVIRRGEKMAAIFAATNINAEKMQKLYIDGGFMLHKNNRLAASPLAIGGSISLYRGLPPWKATNVSGLGMWDKNNCTTGIESAFGVEKRSCLDWFDSLISRIHWNAIATEHTDIEFLNISEPPTYGYWLQRPPTNGVIISRTKNVGERQYYIRRSKDSPYASVLPKHLMSYGEYRRIAIALRVRAGNGPTVKIVKNTNMANILLDYLLPPAEQTFFELYSWSVCENCFDIEGRLARTISLELLDIYKSIFARLGFGVQEV